MTDIDPRDRNLATLPDRRAATLLRLCEVCVGLLPISGAAIAEMTDTNHREQVCATDSVSAVLENLQFTLGEGPSIEAMCSGSPVLVSDLREMCYTRWPIFAEAASRTSARALYAFPLQIGVISVGVLELYRDQPGVLTGAEMAEVLVVADLAGKVLLDLCVGAGPDTAVPQRWLIDGDLRRAEIHRATGMVMAQLKLSAEAALTTMRAFAYSNSQPLEDVAREVANRRLRFPTDGPVLD